MMLHKIFHMNQSVEETQRRLSHVGGYRHHLDGVERADFTGHGVSHWQLALPLGFRADFVMTEAPAEASNTFVFKSLDGDLEIYGVINYHQIKRNLTEVEIVLNYESNSRTFNVLDRMFNLGDRFLVRQLRCVRAHFESIAAPAPHTAGFFGAQLQSALS